MWILAGSIISVVVANLSIRKLREYEDDCDNESVILQIASIIPFFGWAITILCMVAAIWEMIFNNKKFKEKMIKILFGK